MPDRLHALVFNELSAALSMYSRFVLLSEREEITRRIVGVAQTEVAANLRRAAAGRREYAEGLPERKAGATAPDASLAEMRETLLTEAACYESAALIMEDPRRVMDVIPSWRWTDDEAASIRMASVEYQANGQEG